MTDERCSMTDEATTPPSNAANEQADSKAKPQPRKPQAKPATAAPARCPVCTRRLNDGRCSHCGYQQ